VNTVEVKENGVAGGCFNMDKLFSMCVAQHYNVEATKEKDSAIADVLSCYKAAVQLFIAKPVLCTNDLLTWKEQLSSTIFAEIEKANNRASLINRKSSQGSLDSAALRRTQLVQAVKVGTDRLKAGIHEKYKAVG
jgi:hypothetical protein